MIFLMFWMTHHDQWRQGWAWFFRWVPESLPASSLSASCPDTVKGLKLVCWSSQWISKRKFLWLIWRNTMTIYLLPSLRTSSPCRPFDSRTPRQSPHDRWFWEIVINMFFLVGPAECGIGWKSYCWRTRLIDWFDINVTFDGGGATCAQRSHSCSAECSVPGSSTDKTWKENGKLKTRWKSSVRDIQVTLWIFRSQHIFWRFRPWGQNIDEDITVVMKYLGLVSYF